MNKEIEAVIATCQQRKAQDWMVSLVISIKKKKKI